MDAFDTLSVLNDTYRQYVKKDDKGMLILDNFEKHFKNESIRSGSDFIPAAVPQFLSESFEEINRAYKCCFIEHSDNMNKLSCYIFLLDIHNAKSDVTLSLSLN